jgi:pyruvate/2-oxoglutarate/acetoin dehydrogenase E1 component
MYNTLLASDEPGLVIECLNGYRLKETQPDNLAEARLAFGVPEILAEGSDVTLVTYGSCVRVAQEAMKMLSEHNISVELIDVQTLLPFDKYHSIVQSVSKTNRLVVLDEDVPGGASAYILQHILENQNAYQYLDSAPKTITAFAGRSPYGSEGDYFTKPSADDVFETVYNMMREADPQGFMGLFS